MTSEFYEAAIEAIVKGDGARATELANKGLSEGIDPLELLKHGFIPGINKVGDLFDTGTLFLLPFWRRLYALVNEPKPVQDTSVLPVRLRVQPS